MDQREGVAVAVLEAAGLDVDAISEAASAEIEKLPKASGASVQNASLSRAALSSLCRRRRPVLRASEIPTFLPK